MIYTINYNISEHSRDRFTHSLTDCLPAITTRESSHAEALTRAAHTHTHAAAAAAKLNN